MDQDRHHFVAGRIVATLLARTHRALDHSVDHLEMRGVECQRDMHVATRCTQVGGKALVVLDVARALHMRRIVFALELREQH